MRIKTLFIAAVTAVLALAACSRKDTPDPDRFRLAPAELSFPISGGQKAVTLSTNLDWTVQGYTEEVRSWLSLSPASGSGSSSTTSVTVVAGANSGRPRSAELTFYASDQFKAVLKVSQSGMTVKTFIDNADTKNTVALTGTVYNISYGKTLNFDLADETGSVLVYAVQNKSDYESVLEIGGTVAVSGKYKYFSDKKQHEMVDPVISGFTARAGFDDVKTATVAGFLKAAEPAALYRLTGTVRDYDPSYCSFTLEDESGSVLVYSVDAASKAKYAAGMFNGGKVSIIASYYLYVPASGAPVEEITGAKIIGYEAAEAEIVETDVAGVNKGGTDCLYKVRGVCSEITDADNGRWYLTDATGSLYIYGTNDWAAKNISAGDIVTVQGPKKIYNGTVELVNVDVLSVEKSAVRLISPSSVTVPAAGASGIEIRVESSIHNLEVGTSAGWLRFKEFSFNGDEGTLVFCADANPLNESRKASATVTVKEGDRTHNAFVIFTQSGALKADPVGRWLEIPATNDENLYFFSHKMTLGGKTVRNYSFYLDPDARLAAWVAYPLNGSLRGSGSRTDAWGLDPKVPEEYQCVLYKTYDGAFDRGHQLPSADRLAPGINETTFYFTNMTPQRSSLNSGAWATLENKVRTWSNSVDTLYVVTGADFKTSTEYTSDNVGKKIPVPVGYYKALVGYKADASIGGDTGGYVGVAFYFEHREYKDSDIMKAPVMLTIDELESRLGYDFFVNLPDRIGGDKAAKVESVIDGSFWK